MCYLFPRLEKDVHNEIYFITIGGIASVKSGVLPHLFDCQGRSVILTATIKNSLQRKRKIDEIPYNNVHRHGQAVLKYGKQMLLHLR